MTTSYAHAHFKAATKSEFRAGLLAAIRADFRLDIDGLDDPYANLRDGIVRHGVWINGRHIGYEAILNAKGDLVITDLQVIGRNNGPRPLATPAERKARAEDMKTNMLFFI